MKRASKLSDKPIPSVSDNPDRPNILVILTDQQVSTAMSCADNSFLSTPNLDGLAEQGTRFTNAYCAQPLCTPSRASMWTGRTPTEVDIRGNGQSLSGEDLDHQLGAVATRADYDAGYAGKWHLPELSVPEYTQFRHIHPETEAGLADACRDFLEEDRDRPFLLVASLTEPHGSCQWARGQTPPSGPVDEVDWTQWPPLPANYARGAYPPELPDVARAADPHTHPTQGWEESQWRRYIYAYYRLVERADALVGEILDALRDSGHAENTVIVFSSDHGDQLAAHQWTQKWALNEESLRVPLILVEPAGPRGAVRSELVHVGLDLLPTLAEAMQTSVGRPLTGASLLSADASAPWREYLFTETKWESNVMHLTGRAVTDGRFKYTCYAWGRNREQLIDLHTDPGEMNNLAVDFRHFEQLGRMRELIRDEATRVGDAKFASFVPSPGMVPK